MKFIESRWDKIVIILLILAALAAIASHLGWAEDSYREVVNYPQVLHYYNIDCAEIEGRWAYVDSVWTGMVQLDCDLVKELPRSERILQFYFPTFRIKESVEGE